MRSSRGHVLVASFVVLTLGGSACATRTAGPPGPAQSVAAPTDSLARTLDALFSTPPFDRVVWGVSIRVPGEDPLYQRNAHLLLHPASNMKLVTLAVAAERLGWDFRFQTSVHSTSPVDSDGTLRGDLVVIGGGDPTISRRHNGPATLARLADLVWQRGVRRIEGRVIGDGSAFGGTSYGDGWQWDDLPFGYAAPVSALNYNENTAEFLVGPRLVRRRTGADDARRQRGHRERRQSDHDRGAWHGPTAVDGPDTGRPTCHHPRGDSPWLCAVQALRGGRGSACLLRPCLPAGAGRARDRRRRSGPIVGDGPARTLRR